MTNYSITPLQKKLGIREGYRCILIHAPKDFASGLGALPRDAVFVRSREQLDFILFFAASELTLANEFAALTQALKTNGMLWVAWPKKSSGVITDLRFEKVQRAGLDAGLVDVKICSINEIWSGLKFVYRLKDRKER